jgi:hypothetical protein
MIRYQPIVCLAICAAVVAPMEAIVAGDDLVVGDPIGQLAPPAQMRMPRPVDHEHTVGQWVYGTDDESARLRLENQFRKKIAELTRRHHFDEAVQNKLALAARVDIARLTSEVAALKEKLAAAPQDVVLLRKVASDGQAIPAADVTNRGKD